MKNQNEENLLQTLAWLQHIKENLEKVIWKPLLPDGIAKMIQDHRVRHRMMTSLLDY